MVSTVKAQSRFRPAIHQAVWRCSAPEAPPSPLLEGGDGRGSPQGKLDPPFSQAGLSRGRPGR